MNNDNHLSYFIKYLRNKNRMTQEELASKAGVGLRFIRDMEQGKETLRMDKVNQVLALFGYRTSTETGKIKDPYEIISNHMNRNIHVYLKDRHVLVGFILDYVMEEQKITGWKFVSNNHSLKYNETKDPALLQIINHADIENIENL